MSEEVRKHHPYSPSKLGYLEACSHYTGEDSLNTKASDAGTKQHDAAEDPIDIDDPTLEDHEFEAVLKCKAYRDELIAKKPGCLILKEEYLPIDDNTVTDKQGNVFQGTTGGYTDLCIVSGKLADVVDYKFGLWSVEAAEDNLQGIAYALGLFFRFPTLEEITVHFLLPHQDTIDTATFKRSQFPAMLLRVKTVVARAMEAEKNRAAGLWGAARCSASVCLFCGNKGVCHKLADFSLKLGKKYSPLVIPEQLTPSLMFDAKSAKQTLETSQVLEGWCKATRARITARSIEDDAWLPEGYKLRERSDTIIKDQTAFVKAALARGVPQKTIDEAIKYRVEGIYKSIRSKAERGEKDAAEQLFREENLTAGISEKEQPIYFLERIKG